MARYQTEHSANVPSSIGVLITNVGTPDAPTIEGVRRYLSEFLSDPRIVELPRPLWLPILHGYILRTRPKRSALLYESIWTEAGSPLLVFSKRLADKLQLVLGRKATDRVKVALGMRYGNPSIDAALNTLREANMQRLLVLPLFPQYAAATTASTFDAVSKSLRNWRRIPEFHILNGYHDNPAYIRALATSIRNHWQDHGKPQRLLFSFHGIPMSQSVAGDPYAEQCHTTAQLVGKQLKLRNDEWALAFQSRLGPKEWLRPYTDQTLTEWAEAAVKHVNVVCPGFSVDCLETLEEINIRYRQTFLDAGGKKFDYIPALNDSDAHVDALVDVMLKQRG